MKAALAESWNTAVNEMHDDSRLANLLQRASDQFVVSSTLPESTNDDDDTIAATDSVVPLSSQYSQIYAVWTLQDGSGGTCASNVTDRVDCGYYGISQSECETGRGCCYELPYVSGPQCYHHQGSGSVVVNVELAPGSPASLTVIDMYGNKVASVQNKGGVAQVTATDAPVYLVA